MKWLASLALGILHASYALLTLVLSCTRHISYSAPRPLEYPRRQIPKHLALILVTADKGQKGDNEEACICRIVEDMVTWCKAVGIDSLSVYNKQGVLYKYAESIRETLRSFSQVEAGQQDDTECHSDSDVEFPLTPPPSDHSISRPLSRNEYRSHLMPVISMPLDVYRPIQGTSGLKRRLKSRKNKFHLKLLSIDASKSLMAHMARTFANTTVHNGDSKTSIFDIDSIDMAMQGYDLDAPDFMIIHDLSQSSNASLELEGFPPWLVRLTEIHKTRQDSLQIALPWTKPGHTIAVALTEVDFRLALDEFASAEMRIGK